MFRLQRALAGTEDHFFQIGELAQNIVVARSVAMKQSTKGRSAPVPVEPRLLSRPLSCLKGA